MNKELLEALLKPNSKTSYYLIRHWARKSFIEVFRAEELVFGEYRQNGNDAHRQLVDRIVATCRAHAEPSKHLALDYRLQLYKFVKASARRNKAAGRIDTTPTNNDDIEL